MYSKIVESLYTRWSGQLGIKDKKVFERVADSVKTLITSEDQIPQFVEGAEAMLKMTQSEADKVRTELSARVKALEGEKAELEAKLTGKQPEEKPEKPAEQSDMAAAIAAAVADEMAKVVNPLKEELATFKAAKAKEDAVSALDKFVSEWDYAGGFPKERDLAKHIAMKVYKAGGEQMTGEQLIAAFRDEFDPAVKEKGVTDFSKPFKGDGGGESHSARFEAMAKRQSERQGAVAAE